LNFDVVTQKKDKNWNITLTTLPTSQQTSSEVNVHTIVDQLLSTNLIDKSSLVFLGTTDMELKLDFLNRVRMNTLSGRQIFCPVPFVSFHPKVVQWMSRSMRKQTANHFDLENRKYVSFFASDYLKAKEKLVDEDPAKVENSLCNFFR
jgi:hypothetical protein